VISAGAMEVTVAGDEWVLVMFAVYEREWFLAKP
jgi:hypothetical protein